MYKFNLWGRSIQTYRRGSKRSNDLRAFKRPLLSPEAGCGVLNASQRLPLHQQAPLTNDNSTDELIPCCSLAGSARMCHRDHRQHDGTLFPVSGQHTCTEAALSHTYTAWVVRRQPPPGTPRPWSVGTLTGDWRDL
ncbi:hypothetical protein E2C01_010690 [Portunus trituberculatus]|uniref:Uncharacterized protein n=1 Tax=Portunus trituberculatus TaxID=210409 RepID=A0A5B7D9G5_PORTR|nr:hypothetical protein [Portunus trituberculatus]